MIKANELRIGNLVTWNPRLVSPKNTLPSMLVEVFAILPDRVLYVHPNIENRVEPFEDDVAQTGSRYKLLEELEPVILTPEILLAAGFEEKSGLLTTHHFQKGELQLKPDGHYFQRIAIHQDASLMAPILKSFHQLQNLYFALTGEELPTKLHGQQS